MKKLRVGLALSLALLTTNISSQTLTMQGFASGQISLIASAVYVDCNGLDTNDGLTLSTPVLTFSHAHTVVGTSGRSTVYIRGKSFSGGGACTYAPTSATNSIGNHSNENWIGYPPDGHNAALIKPTFDLMGCASCSNILLGNLTFDGTNVPATSPFMQFNNSPTDDNNISILGNIFQNIANTAIQNFNTTNLSIQGNTLTNVGVSKAVDAIAYDGTSSASPLVLTGVVVTDNIINGCARFCIEIVNTDPIATIYFASSHFDRNTITNFSSAADGAMSIVGEGGGVPATGNTVYGNTITRAAGGCASGGANGIEMAMGYTTYSNNTVTDTCTAGLVSACVGCAIFSNTLNLDSTATAHNSFGIDGGYNSTEWIGSNTVFFSTSNVMVGCTSGSPGFCALGFNSYGSEPTVWTASSPWSNPY